MPEEVKATKLPPLPTQTIERNGVKLDFVSTEYLRGNITDDKGNVIGSRKGQLYLAPVVAEDNLIPIIIPWVGGKDSAAKFGAFLKQLAQGWWEWAVENATDEATGEVNQQKLLETFIQAASSFSARGEKMQVLKDQLEEAVTAMTEIDETLPKDQFMAKFQELSGEVRRLQIEIASKKRKGNKTDNED